MPPPQMSAFLQAAVDKAKAKAKATQASMATSKGEPTAASTVPQHAQPPLSAPQSPSQHPKQPEKQPNTTKPTKVKTIRKSPPDSAREGVSLLPAAVTTLLDPIEAIEFFRTHSTNTAAFDLLAPHLPAMMTTIISGAMIRGTAGYQDRMTVMRMLGAPFTPSSSTRGDLGQQVEALTDRFSKAVSRVERRLSGPKPVTVDADYTLEPALQAENAA